MQRRGKLVMPKYNAETNNKNQDNTSEILNWIDITRDYELEMQDFDNNYKHKIYLNRNFTEQNTPEIFKLPLLPHQRNTVRAMLDLEKKRFVKLHQINDAYIDFTAETQAGVLSEPPSSGKTYEILAVIALNPVPRKINEYTSINLPRAHELHSTEWRYRDEFKDLGFGYEIRKSYENNFRQTFIFVGKSVLTSWINKITAATPFKVFVIEDCKKLNEFYNLALNPATRNLRKFNKYDIVLIKNGIVSGKFDTPELTEALRNIKSKSILAVFGDILKFTRVARVVLDDFDVLDITSNAHVIPANFTWFVSATRKNPSNKKITDRYYRLSDLIINHRPVYVNMWQNRELYSLFNIGCETEYISDSMKASKIHYQIYRFVNPNETYISAIGAIGTEEAREIMEMLNADADSVAAKRAGCKTTRIADIFEKVLDKKFHHYKKNIEIEKYIVHVNEFINGLDPLLDIKFSISETNISLFRKNLQKPGPFNQLPKLIKFQESTITDTVNEINDKNKTEKEENGRAIERVKDNLRQGECPISCEKLNEVESIVIMKCCGIIIASEVVSWAMKLHKESSDSVRGLCPNCRAQVGINNMILISRDIDLDKILNDDILEQDETTPESEPESEPEPELIDESAPNKLNCILKIINGTEKDFSAHKSNTANQVINGLLEGENSLGMSPIEDRKIIVFSNYNESMIKIESRLIGAGIRYKKLQGLYSNIDEIVRQYKLPNSDPESIKVLLISGAQYCAGLDLENTTDIIFTHNVIDGNIRTQLAGRAARYGRRYDLNIHLVLYHNEYGAISQL